MNKSAEKYQSIAAENKYFIEIRAYQRKLNTTKKKTKTKRKRPQSTCEREENSILISARHQCSLASCKYS